MMTMLGFATVQYFAICRPLHHLYVLRRRKVVVFLALTWTTSLVGGFVPLTVLALIVRAENCAAWLLRLNFQGHSSSWTTVTRMLCLTVQLWCQDIQDYREH